MDEYTMLREELMDKMKSQDNLTQFCYTIVAAIWTLAFTVQISYILLIPLFIVIPISFRIVKLRNDCAFLSAYMSVLLEKNIDIKWESKNKLFGDKTPKKKSKKLLHTLSKFDFIFLVLVSIIMFWIVHYAEAGTFLIANNCVLMYLLIFLQVFVVAAEIAVLVNFLKFSEQRSEYSNQWEEVLKNTNKE